jgi:hypothetical protein
MPLLCLSRSWERFRDETLITQLQEGIEGGFSGQPQETAIDIQNLQRA